MAGYLVVGGPRLPKRLFPKALGNLSVWSNASPPPPRSLPTELDLAVFSLQGLPSAMQTRARCLLSRWCAEKLGPGAHQSLSQHSYVLRTDSF